jgi:hypothetical protein
MKKIILVIMAVVLISVFAGCALFQKPPDDPAAKAAWIQQSKLDLTRTDFIEMTGFIAFGAFCASNQIPPNICAAGVVANDEYLKNSTLAQTALDDYGAGKITQIEAQQKLELATIASLQKALAAFMSGKDLVKQKAVQTRNMDLFLPSGKAAPVPQKK